MEATEREELQQILDLPLMHSSPRKLLRLAAWMSTASTEEQEELLGFPPPD